MTGQQVVGAVLTAIGAIVLLWGGLFWTRHDTVIDAGPVKVQRAQHEGVRVPPIAGGVILIAGIALLVVPSRVRT